ncbi:MAG: hypothetical protein M0017_02395 [Desulfobacteraceae bacterium]|nr:hypothetical protein [Desulfobacteraceae bacterium]
MHQSKKLSQYLDVVTNVMEAYTAALFTVADPQEKTLKIFSCRSFSKKIDPSCLLAPGEGFVSWVHREQKSVLVKNFDRSTTTLKFYREDEEIKSLLAVPLPDKEGVLYVDSKKSYRFTEEKEKICHQLAITALALIRGEQEEAEKRVVDNLLGLSDEMDELLGREGAREALLRDGLEIVSRRLGLDFAFFVVPEEVVHYCQPGARAGHYIHRTVPPSSFSRDGLLGWSIKNRKKIVREKISGAKSFVLNKEESLGPFANFVGVPLSLPGGTKKGGVGLIRPPAATWHAREVDTAAAVAQRFFRVWTQPR